MVSVTACYEDNDCRTFSHITKISYNGYDEVIEVSEEKLITHSFPIGVPLWLYSDNGVAVIHGSGLRCVVIVKE